MATRVTRSRRSRYGRLYRGGEGQWTWVAHRVTGVVIILFLFAHVVDTAVVGWGPAAYDKVMAVYRNPVVGVLEYVLVACVDLPRAERRAHHGDRLLAEGSARHRPLSTATLGIFVAAMIPITIIMGNRIIQELVR